MRKFIILKGASNVGKTSTLEILIKKLLAKDARLIYPTTVSDISSFVICEFGGHRIGIITFGDPTSESEVQACLDDCEKKDCDTIYAASRTRGAVYDILYNFAAEHHFATIETSPLYAWKNTETGLKPDKLNETFAEMLISLI